ncbi:DNA cytosine methyltransferase [Lactobacillus iners]|uniref:DNA cytosine methyltransferase n=2 Tax=Bacteria TaxID=2 RepID=UPI000C801152|nr:DNA cytosine methyltransferase [Lactobacillus iners]MDK7316866.1 DNA cytosine methyltransferase [Lactobacillus iners]PMC42198.1 DNA (cytosine-5-)-methyltransferase [Lactobacillus iners]
MHGGSRIGAGRNKIPKEERKKAKSIYLTKEEYDIIDNLKIDGCNSFSQKCTELINYSLELLCSYEKDELEGKAMINEKGVFYKVNNKEKNREKLRFIDLFAGIGGIRKAFEYENTECVFSSEWDQFAAKTYFENYHEMPYGDITKIDEKNIPDHDVLLAGFPCQPFSNIGKREGFAHETQGTLFFDVLRILKEKQPKMFLLENVKGLLNNDGGRTFKVILGNLKELGYSIFYDVLDAQNFGLAQRRERVIIVGFHPDLEVKEFKFPRGDSEHRVPVKDILEHNPKGYTISKRLQKNYLFKKNDGKPQIVDFDSDIQVNTLVASYHKIQRLTGTFVRDGETGIRLLSELECKRLMGFPEDFVFPVSRTQMYRQLGNSVAIPMVKAVADEMKIVLKQADNISTNNV